MGGCVVRISEVPVAENVVDAIRRARGLWQASVQQQQFVRHWHPHTARSAHFSEQTHTTGPNMIRAPRLCIAIHRCHDSSQATAMHPHP